MAASRGPQGRPFWWARRGVVLGTAANGEAAIVPFFTAGRPTRAAALGDPALPALIAVRAIGAGARLQVVTSRPEEWLRLRDRLRFRPERLVVVRQGTTTPACGTPAAPWMIIDDIGARAVTVPALRGLDAIVLHRSTPACRAAAIAALSLPDPVAASLHGIPRDVVVIASAGLVRRVPLRLDAAERALLAELGLPNRRSNDCPIAAGLTGAVSFETKGTGLEGEVA